MGCVAGEDEENRPVHGWVPFLPPSFSMFSLPLFPGDGVDFLSWFLNALHSALGGTKKKKKSKSCCLSKENPISFVFAFFLERHTYTASSILRQSLAGAPAGLELRSSCLSFLCTEMTLNASFFCFHPQKLGLQACAIRLC